MLRVQALQCKRVCRGILFSQPTTAHCNTVQCTQSRPPNRFDSSLSASLSACPPTISPTHHGPYRLASPPAPPRPVATCTLPPAPSAPTPPTIHPHTPPPHPLDSALSVPHLSQVLLHKLTAHYADEGGSGVVRNSLGQHGLACCISGGCGCSRCCSWL